MTRVVIAMAIFQQIIPKYSIPLKLENGLDKSRICNNVGWFSLLSPGICILRNSRAKSEDKMAEIDVQCWFLSIIFLSAQLTPEGSKFFIYFGRQSPLSSFHFSQGSTLAICVLLIQGSNHNCYETPQVVSRYSGFLL